MKMESKIVEGMVLEDRGYASAYFANNDALECYLEKPYILISDKRLNNINDLMPLLQSVAQINRPLLIIGEEIDGDVLSTLVLNRLRGGLPICAIKAPSYGDNRKNILNDIAILTGGQLVSDDTGIELQQVTADSGLLGQAKSITVTKTTTTIVGGYGDKVAIDSHVKKIETEIENVKDEFTQKKLHERLGKLTTGIGVIQCGASTEAELKEKKDRVDDAFNSAKNSIKSGVVPGGGVTLLNASKIIKFDKSELTDDESLGVDVLIKSLTAPIKRILDNAGEKTDLIVANIIEDDSNTKGFDVVSKSYVDMFEHGIVDPTAVIISEVKNASSIAGLMLTTDSSIVDIEEESDKKNIQQMPMM
jgi:chaperonin GroEL